MTRRNLELVEPLRAGARGVTLLETIDATVTPDGRAPAPHLAAQSPLQPGTHRGAARRRHGAGGRHPRPLPAPRGARRGARHRAAGRARRRRPGHPARTRRAPRLVPPPARCARRAPEPARRATTAPRSPRPKRPSTSSPISGSSWPPRSRSGRRPRSPRAGAIRRGYDAELDESRDLRDGGKQYIAALQQRERERTGIPSLKVGYNKVFGYYLEVTHAHASRVPPDYERRQTLTGAERYVTPELKEYESKVLSAEERMASREAELVAALRDRVGGDVARIQRTAQLLARLDVWSGLAERAVHGRYVRPACHRGLRSVADRQPARRHRADDAARGVHAERRALHRIGAGAAGDGAQHGRQEHHPPADRALRGAGADGRLCPRRRRRNRDRRPALYPRGRQRQPGAGAEHLHGGDGGDQRHPPQRHERRPWSSSTRSAAAPAPTTAWPSPGRSASTCTIGSAARRCSPPTITS